jgi:hypothetical protein
VNLEVDVLAKYVEKAIRAHPAEPGASAEAIRAHPAEPGASAEAIRAHPAEPSSARRA